MANNSIITKVTGTDTSSNRIASTFYGTCATAAGTAAKEVTLSDSCVFNDSCLVTGVTIHVKFTNSNTNATPTLKVGTATAKQIMKYGTTKAGTTTYTSWYAGAVVSFTYDGTYWVMNDHIDGEDISTKMDKVNPTGSGSFSLNSAGTTGNYSFAEGYACKASGVRAHSEGFKTVASGVDAHAEGSSSVASGTSSHAQGIYTLAQRKSQHTFGEYNIADTSGADTTVRGQYVEIVGNGTADNSRSNARTLDWSGNEVLSGTIEATGFGTTLDREVDRGGVQLTQAEYDALPATKLTDGVNYFITDAPGDVGNIIHATGVTYDNSDSRLYSVNVQAAIDEICKSFIHIDEIKNFIKLKTISLLCTQLTQGLNLSSYVALDAGYKFLCWLPTGASDGWITSFPIYLANVNLPQGNVYWNGTMGSGTNRVKFSYLEIRGA